MFSIFLLLFACPQSRIDDADPSGMPYCDETSQSIDRDDDSGIGIPASDLLDALPFAEELALSWERVPKTPWRGLSKPTKARWF